jgi:hypothetical protein
MATKKKAAAANSKAPTATEKKGMKLNEQNSFQLNSPSGASAFHLWLPSLKCFPLANNTRLYPHHNTKLFPITGRLRPITGRMRPVIDFPFCDLQLIPDIYKKAKTVYQLPFLRPQLFLAKPAIKTQLIDYQLFSSLPVFPAPEETGRKTEVS